jgi:hypothetical protein
MESVRPKNITFCILHLVTITDLSLSIDFNDSSKLDQSATVKRTTEAEIMTISSKIVPFVNVDTVGTVSDNLYKFILENI